MALTDIAKQLKATFEEEFGGSGLQEEVRLFREIYDEAESIRIGDMDYIVINQAYKRQEYADVPDSISPLFFNSIKNSYAIIDSETSSTLIDEVYSRITYMQRVCKVETLPEAEEIINSFEDLLGEGVTATSALVRDNDAANNTANIFQCQLIKDTGVSAAPDVYSFMLKNGEIKEIADNVMQQIRHTGEVNLMRDTEMLKTNEAAIQQAVFDKYINADIDIQSISVKSIFEISMTFAEIQLRLTDEEKRLGYYDSVYMASEGNEFETLNANIHVCNSCGHEIVDVKDSSKIHKLHVNMDAYYDDTVDPDKPVYAVGCEGCLQRCEKCGGWHFNYSKLDPTIYAKVRFARGREFIRGLRAVEANYCTCREGIEWVYDDESGTETEHDVIDIKKMAFINYANEKLDTYEGFNKFYEKAKKEREKKGELDAIEECKFAKSMIAKYKAELAKRFEIDTRDIKITSIDRCSTCSVCGGEYYCGNLSSGFEYDYRCNVCDELIAEKRSIVTRSDGMIFMRAKSSNGYAVRKYVMTKFGNLRLVSDKKLESGFGAQGAVSEETVMEESEE